MAMVSTLYSLHHFRIAIRAVLSVEIIQVLDGCLYSRLDIAARLTGR
jgi:hypothetical protein